MMSRVAQRASSVVRPQNSAVRERGIVHRVWRCLARLRIGTPKPWAIW